MADVYPYGATKRLTLKLVDSNGDGINAVLVAGDVWIVKDTGTGFAGNSAQITNLPTLVDSANMPGTYEWLPDAGETTCRTFRIDIDGTGALENSFVYQTIGHPSAFWNY